MQQASSETSIHSVRRYYEQNTRLFRVGGLGNRSYAVHRALWDASVTTIDAALQRVNALVLEEVQAFLEASPTVRLHLIDLGCGVGGTLAYCARALPEARMAGVTLSMTQARIARRILPRARAAVITADFHDLPCAPCFHIAVAIEAFAHSHDPQRALEQAHAVLVPGGRLIICDDTIARLPSSESEARWLAAFRDGWRVPGVCTRAAMIARARRAGFALRSTRNLTGLLRLHRLPALLAGAARAGLRLVSRVHPFAQSISGSIALQECLARGIITYEWLVFEKTV